MALFGDTGKFVSMAEQRIAAVESSTKSICVGVIASREESPILVGYSPRRPSGMEMGDRRLDEAVSGELLKAARSGWFWDPQTETLERQAGFQRCFGHPDALANGPVNERIG